MRSFKLFMYLSLALFLFLAGFWFGRADLEEETSDEIR